MKLGKGEELIESAAFSSFLTKCLWPYHLMRTYLMRTYLTRTDLCVPTYCTTALYPPKRSVFSRMRSSLLAFGMTCILEEAVSYRQEAYKTAKLGIRHSALDALLRDSWLAVTYYLLLPYATRPEATPL